jgi:hypothetical protein
MWQKFGMAEVWPPNHMVSDRNISEVVCGLGPICRRVNLGKASTATEHAAGRSGRVP